MAVPLICLFWVCQPTFPRSLTVPFHEPPVHQGQHDLAGPRHARAGQAHLRNSDRPAGESDCPGKSGGHCNIGQFRMGHCRVQLGLGQFNGLSVFGHGMFGISKRTQIPSAVFLCLRRFVLISTTQMGFLLSHGTWECVQTR